MAMNPKNSDVQSIADWVRQPSPPPSLTAERLSPRKSARRRMKKGPSQSFATQLPLDVLERLNQATRDTGSTRTEMLSDALELYFESQDFKFEDRDLVAPGNDAEIVVRRNGIDKKVLSLQEAHAARNEARRRAKPAPASPKLQRVRTSVDALIATLEEALNFDPGAHVNEAPPSLRQDGDRETLDLLRQILAELKAIKTLLKTGNGLRKVRKEAGRLKSLEHYADRFMDGAVTTAGRGAAVLFLLSINQLLADFGFMASIQDKVGSFFKE